MKSYLRFEPKDAFGVIASPKCNAIFDFSGSLAISGGVRDIGLWNLRQATQIATFRVDEPNYPYSTPPEVCVLADSKDKRTFLAGYSNGDLRVFNYVTKSLVAVLRGHNSAVSCISVNNLQTGLAASGGVDCEIILWDLVSLSVTCRLSGHKDSITGLGFIMNASERLLVSVSKDTLLKVWDFEASHCVQTVVGHRSEIWSLQVLENSRIITGSNDDLLRGFRVSSSSTTDNILEYYGCVKRESSIGDRCASIAISTEQNILVAQSSGKIADVYRIRTQNEAIKRMKRRLRRIKEKARSETNWEESVIDEGDEIDEHSTDEFAVAASELEDMEPKTTTLSDELEVLGAIRCSAKIKGFSFSPLGISKNDAVIGLVTLANNSLEIYTLPTEIPTHGAWVTTKTSIIDLHGHRSDVRAVAVSADNSTLATCSSEGVKLWSSRTNSCIKNCECGYGVSIAFAPGSRYIICGTADGHVKIMDAASGSTIIDEAAHGDSAVWTIAVRPDGKGFMTGAADKIVKFWEFGVSAGVLTAAICRQLKMTSEVLCVRYSPTRAQDKLLVAVGLLDCTVKVFYDDSLKFFLSLFGHKLPVLSIDISYDSTIIVTGSADKTVKIWGLDFGDCHRSLIAHEDSITVVRFQPQTHYFFTASKDGLVKYWDADRFEQIQHFPGHSSAVWGLDISADGSRCVSCGQDRSIRTWERGEDLVFIEEERERAIESQVETAAVIQNFGSSILDGKQTAESLKGGELLMEAVDQIEVELLSGEAKSNPNLLGLSPLKYFLRCLRQITSADLESALLVMPVHYVERFVNLLLELSRRGLDVELCARTMTFLLRCHMSQLITSGVMRAQIEALGSVLKTNARSYQLALGSNLAGLHILRQCAGVGEPQIFSTTKQINDDVNTSRNPKKRQKKT